MNGQEIENLTRADIRSWFELAVSAAAAVFAAVALIVLARLIAAATNEGPVHAWREHRLERNVFFLSAFAAAVMGALIVHTDLWYGLPKLI